MPVDSHESAADENGQAQHSSLHEGLGETALVEDPNQAHEMAEAQDPVRVMITNMEKSDLPENVKKTLREKLEQDAEELSEAAREKYEKNQKAYNTIRDEILGDLTALMQDKIPKEETEILDLWPGIDSRDDLDGLLTSDQILELRNLVYILTGTQPPELTQSENEDDWEKIREGIGGPMYRGNLSYRGDGISSGFYTETPTAFGFKLIEEHYLVKSDLNGPSEIGRVEIKTSTD